MKNLWEQHPSRRNRKTGKPAPTNRPCPATDRRTTTSSYDVYMVDTPKNNSGDDKENPEKSDPLRHNQSAGVSGAALNRAASETATLAQETITLRMVPKTQKNPMNKLPNKTIGKMGKSALTNRP